MREVTTIDIVKGKLSAKVGRKTISTFPSIIKGSRDSDQNVGVGSQQVYGIASCQY